MATKIVLRYLDGKDKVTLLNEVIARAGLEGELEAVRKRSKKQKKNFTIAIKPNASMFVRRDDDGVTTDPVLVLALVEWLHERGYADIMVVESPNAYGVTYTERNPVTIMTAMGLNGGRHEYAPACAEMTAHVASAKGKLMPYRLVDLGADTTVVPADNMPGGHLKVASAWLNADFRISFAKFKTHVYGGYTLLVKNTYGCLPEEDKMLHYHKPTGCSLPTVEQLKKCPVHFGIVDAIISADGWMGVKWDRAIPRRPGFIMAGRNICETEKMACRVMGVPVENSLMTKSAMELMAEPSKLDGDIRPLGPWWNVPGFIVKGFPATEKHYYYYKFQQTVTDGVGLRPFRRKPAGLILTYVLVLPALIYAFHRRHWIIRKYRDLKLRRAVMGGPKAPGSVRGALDRLDAGELELLLACLRSDVKEAPVIYGHRVRAAGKWHSLPDSTFSRLVRVPEILAALKNEEERERCAGEVEARIGALKR